MSWLTLREIDQRRRAPKGTAFRAFKRLEPIWREGREYRVLHAERDAAEIEALRAAGRVYATSRTIILLSADAASRI